MKENEDKEKRARRERSRWVLWVFALSVAISAVLSLGSEVVLEGADFWAAVAVLLFFILLGIVFDMIGVATTAADAAPFHSMAAHRTKGASEAIRLLQNADRVSSFCNDVIGDICGVVSGATAAVIVQHLHAMLGGSPVLLSVAVTALISGLMIGGKAASKHIAIAKAKDVVFFTARVLRTFHWGR